MGRANRPFQWGCGNIAETVYSFSRLSAFEQCKYQYYLNYVISPEERPEKEENAFAVYGGFVHQILEDYANGKLAVYELLEKYSDEFDVNVPIDFPPNAFVNLRDSYYNGGYAYFESFDGFDYLGATKILGVEQDFIEDFGDFKLKGFIDLILEDEDGNIIIVDHKSKKEIKTKADKRKYGRQLFLYSHYIKSKYGKYPTKVIFNMFRSGTVLVLPFNMQDYEEAIEWARKQVAVIENITEWPPIQEEFFCTFLCDYRSSCEYAFKKEDLE